jgi:drug/metabolite transporter (DMT)-like permease
MKVRFSVGAGFIGLCFIWGSSYLFIKIGIELWPPFLLAALRNLVACFVVAMLMVFLRKTLPRRWREWRHLILFAFINGSGFALIFWGEQYISSGQAAVLVATFPFFTLLLARWWTREGVHLTQYLAVVIGFVGVVLTFMQREGVGFSGQDEMRLVAQWAVIGAAFCYALSYSFSKRYISGDVYTNTAIHLGVSGLYMLVLSFVMDPPLLLGKALSWEGLSILLYLALIGSALAYGLAFFLIERLHSVTHSYIMLINPMVAVLLGFLFLGESLTFTAALGIVVVIFGAWLGNRHNASTDSPSSKRKSLQKQSP